MEEIDVDPPDWLRPVVAIAAVVATAGAGIYMWSYIHDRFNPDDPSEVVVEGEPPGGVSVVEVDRGLGGSIVTFRYQHSEATYVQHQRSNREPDWYLVREGDPPRTVALGSSLFGMDRWVITVYSSQGEVVQRFGVQGRSRARIVTDQQELAGWEGFQIET